jgi:Flp pilus assembly protein TadD
VGKPKRNSNGFSAAKPTAAPKQQVAKSSADHAAKEQQAVALINPGKLQEAEAIYRDLITAGTRNHIVNGNLAAICGMQGRFAELIELPRKTLQLKHNYPDAHNNLGNALKEKGHN